MGDKNSLPDTVREITRGEGVSTVIELTGNPDVASLSLNLLKVSGKLVLVAYGAGSSFHVNTLMMVSREIEIYGARWCGREELRECVELVSEEKIRPYISEVHPLNEVNSVLKRLEAGKILGRAVLVPKKDR